MTPQNVRGCYLNFEHDRAADWDWLAKWQPNVIRYMGPGSIADPASFDVNRVRRIHDTCPDATILLRCWDVDDNNFKAHDAMVVNPKAEAKRQVEWWSEVFERADDVDVPSDKLMAGLNNETGPEKDHALYPYTEEALDYATDLHVRLGVFVFSVGRPSLPGEAEWTIDSFARLEPLILANKGAIVLHQYMQPEGMYAVWTDKEGDERKDWTYLMGRDRRWPTHVPIIIGEWGIDGILYNRHPDPKYGNSGWRNFKDEWPPNRYADEYVECVRQASDNVIGICPFLSDFSDHKWQSFDLLDAYEEFLARKDSCVKEIAPSNPTPGPGSPLGPVPPPVQPLTGEVVTRKPSNIRNAPNFESDILEVAPIGTRFTLTGDAGEFYQVEHNSGPGGHPAYVHESVVSRIEDEPPVQPPPQGDTWTRSLAFILQQEGGWADDPNDSGGATMKGITIGTFKAWRAAHGQQTPTKDDLRNISDAEVEQIYREWYWLASGSDKLSWPLCLANMDTAVNAGVGRADEMLRRSNGNFLAYMGHLIDWYTRIENFEHFGRGWIRRRAAILLEASKP